MAVWNRDLSEIGTADLEVLVSAGVAEGRDLEYKRELPGNSDADKREFLGDICSLANAGGGDLVFGVDESAGVASEVTGVDLPDPDKEILRQESIIRSGLGPRLPGIHSRDVSLSNGRHVLIVRVPRSFNRPHASTQSGRLRFHSRSSRGKYDMDVAEIRNMAVGSEALSERVRSFRSQRLGQIKQREGPAMLQGRGLMVLHALPLAAFDTQAPAQVDLTAANRDHWSLLKTIGTSGDAPRYNFDGLVRVSRNGVGEPESYAQLFRSGSVEMADGFALDDREQGTASTIPSVAFERYLIESLRNNLELQRLLGVEPPILIALSLLDVEGYTMPMPPGSGNGGAQIDREDLVGPEIMLDEFDEAAGDQQATAVLLRPALDAVWNACGYPRSLNFDADGRWSERLR